MRLAALAPSGRLCSGPCGGRASALCAAHMPRPGLRAGPGVTAPGARRPRRLRGTRRAPLPPAGGLRAAPLRALGSAVEGFSSRALRGCPAPLCGPVCAGLRACAVGPARALARLRPCRPSGPGRRGPPPGPPCGPSPPLALRRGRAPPRGGGWGAASGPRLLSSRRAPRVRGSGSAAVAFPVALGLSSLAVLASRSAPLCAASRARRGSRPHEAGKAEPSSGSASSASSRPRSRPSGFVPVSGFVSFPAVLWRALVWPCRAFTWHMIRER